jgi:hypothetical protein
MGQIVIKSVFLFALAVVMAAIEIESEGKYGWADKAPTWYRTTGIAARIYGLIMSGKPLTGYHTFMFLLPLFIFHVQFIMGNYWTPVGEAMALATYFLVCPCWDFLWFVLNPYYGIKNFRKDKIWWHAKSIWIGPVPLDYIVGLTASILLAAIASYFNDGFFVLKNHLLVIGLILFFIGVTVALAPIYHQWYWFMRHRDERDKVEIFYD